MTTNPPTLPPLPGGKPAVLCAASCQKCAKRGLPWVAVIDTVVDKADAARLAQAGHSYPAAFDAEFAGLRRAATVPAARLPGAGFVWVLYEDIGRWDIWETFADGSNRLLLQKVSPQDYAKQSPGLKPSTDEQVCARGAANLGAGFFTISGAISHRSVWLAFTAHLLAPAVLKAYTTDAHGQRAKRMTQLRAQAWVQGGAQPPHSLALSEATLKAHVAEYADAPPGGPATSPLVKAFGQAGRRFDMRRLGRAKDMQAHARAMEQAAGPACKDRALIIRLRDDVGVAEEHNHLRLLAAERKKAWAIGGPDETGAKDDALRPWKLRSSLHVDVIEGWARAQARDDARQYVTRELNKNIPPVTEEDWQRGLADGTYPAGTTWEPLFLTRSTGLFPPKVEPVLDARGQPVAQTVASRQRPGQQTRLGRIGWPSAAVKQVADQHYGGSTAEGRVSRYREKLRWAELSAWRDAFKAASERWDAFIARYDADLADWRSGPAWALALRHDYTQGLNLSQPKPEHGTPGQQVQDAIARMEAVDAAWGGGAAGPATAKELAALLGKNPDDPANWIDNALLAPFSLANEVGNLNNAGLHKDLGEKSRSAVELPSVVHEALAARRERLEAVALSLIHAREQGMNLAISAIDPDRAKALGMARSTAEQVDRLQTIHVRTAAVLAEVISPKDIYATVRVKLPVGQTIDALSEAFAAGSLPMALEAKNATTRQERRSTARSLRKLAGRPGLTTPEFYPLVLKESTLKQLARQAARTGEALVEVVPDSTLGGLNQPFKLPQSLALKLVGEQASAARAARQAAGSRMGMATLVVALLQARALNKVLGDIKTAQGYDQVDALMSLFSASTGLLEGGLSMWALYYDLRSQGSKLVLASTFTKAATMRLAIGVFGAAGSGFDAVAAFAKAVSRRERGDAQAAPHYLGSGGAYTTSMFSLGLSASAMFARAMAQRASTSAIGAISEMVVMRLGGAAAAAYLGTSLTGIGIVLAIAGFGWSLYAQSLEDDLNEIFLKRSFWGTGHPQGQFGSAKAKPAGTDAGALQLWVDAALRDEQSAFAALSVGFKASLAWQDNWWSDDQVQAKIESATNSGKRRIAYTLTLYGDVQRKHRLASREDKAATLTFDDDSGRHVLEISVPMTDAQWEAARVALFTYNVYEEFERVSLGRDTLIVNKP